MAEGWIQNYLGGIVEVDEKDTWTADKIRDFIKCSFDLLKNAMLVGAVSFLASKENGGILPEIASIYKALLFGVTAIVMFSRGI